MGEQSPAAKWQALYANPAPVSPALPGPRSPAQNAAEFQQYVFGPQGPFSKAHFRNMARVLRNQDPHYGILPNPNGGGAIVNRRTRNVVQTIKPASKIKKVLKIIVACGVVPAAGYGFGMMSTRLSWAAGKALLFGKVQAAAANVLGSFVLPSIPAYHLSKRSLALGTLFGIGGWLGGKAGHLRELKSNAQAFGRGVDRYKVVAKDYLGIERDVPGLDYPMISGPAKDQFRRLNNLWTMGDPKTVEAVWKARMGITKVPSFVRKGSLADRVNKWIRRLRGGAAPDALPIK